MKIHVDKYKLPIIKADVSVDAMKNLILLKQIFNSRPILDKIREFV